MVISSHVFLVNPGIFGAKVWQISGILANIINSSTSERRVVFSRGDYIKYSSRIGQIKEICLYEHIQLYPVSRRLFALVRPIRLTKERDKTLDLPLVKEYSSDILIGLPLIKPKKLYIINIGNMQEDLVLVDQSIQFL